MPRRDPARINYPLRLFITDLWLYTAGFHRRLVFLISLFFLTASASLLPPLLLARIIDNLTSNYTNQIPLLVFLLFFISYGRIVARNRLKLQIYKLAEHCRLYVRQLWISTILQYDLDWHESQSSGKKISILARGSDHLKTFVQFLTKGGGMIDITVNVFGIILALFLLNPKYALLCLANALLYVLVLTQQTRRLNPQRHQINRLSDLVVGKNFDYFSNMSLIKSLGIGQNINRFLFNRELKFTHKSINYHTLEFNKWIYINTISQIFNFVGVGLIIFDITQQRITLGSFFIYTGYINRLQDGLSDIADWINEIIEKYLGLFRVRQLLTSGTATTERGHLPFPSTLSHITLENLDFKYKTSPLTLRQINLRLTAGKKYGFVGASGSGKSTLTKLLLKLYLPTRGNIFYNDLPLRSINTQSLHQHLSVAPQDSDIFNLSFKENITISSNSARFNPHLYDLAIKVAECQSILNKIKNNHQTLLGEKGVKLSGGERQRLGIARAIYKNTPIIIFDESTSSLDSKTEAKILQNLEKYFATKTIIWIAHRLSTLRFTDEIVVFDQGQITELGSFRTLLNHRGTFFDLWQIQKKTALHS